MARASTFLATFALLLSVFSELATAEYHLKLVQVLFRHGERTPRAVEMYPDDPYNITTYEPYGLGQLTIIGKRREYRIGELLRARYNSFLGDIYHPTDVYAVSTDVDRTKMSLLLVLAALYPATAGQIWNPNLPWLPIPIHYTPENIDIYLKPHQCPKYKSTVECVKNTEEVRKKIAEFSDLFHYLSEKTGVDNLGITQVYEIYNLLTAQIHMQLDLPTWCSGAIYEQIQNAVKLEYEIRSYNTKLKRMNGGMMVRKLIENMDIHGKKDNPRKIYLYSGHEVNVVALAKALNLTEPKLPDYGSAIIIEKLENDKGKLFVRMFLWTGVTEKLIQYRIPGCESMCTMDEFVDLAWDVIPSDQDTNCLWDAISQTEIRYLYDEKISLN